MSDYNAHCPSNENHLDESSQTMKIVLRDFVPGCKDVICGRGRRCTNHPGNKRYFQMIQDSIPEYSRTRKKVEKTRIIRDVIDRVKENGYFVKHDPLDGEYSLVSDYLVHDKTSQAFRDALNNYKALHGQSKTAKKRKSSKTKKLKMAMNNFSSSLVVDTNHAIEQKESINGSIGSVEGGLSFSNPCCYYRDEHSTCTSITVDSDSIFARDNPTERNAVCFDKLTRKLGTSSVLLDPLKEKATFPQDHDVCVPFPTAINALPFASSNPVSSDNGRNRCIVHPMLNSIRNAHEWEAWGHQTEAHRLKANNGFPIMPKAKAQQDSSPNSKGHPRAMDLFEKLSILADISIEDGDPFSLEPNPI